MDLAVGIYELSKSFPADERFGLTSQIRRSAVSVPSNIAEGHARKRTGDFRRFLSISQGSLAELETQAILAGRLGFSDPAKVESILSMSDEIGRMTSGLISKLESRS